MIFPFSDDNTRLTKKPFMSWFIIGICMLIYLFQMSDVEKSAYSAGAIPYEITQGKDLVGEVEIVIEGQRAILKHQEAPVTPRMNLFFHMFLHGSFIHLLGNMIFFLVLGDQVEEACGHLGFFLLYVVGGIAGALPSLLLNGDSLVPMVGASGALCAIAGVYVVLHPKNEILVLIKIIPWKMPSWVFLALFAGSQLIGLWVLGLGSKVSHISHLGGLAFGCLVGLILREFLQDYLADHYKNG